jgi:3',5'-cyclic-AMP phosphodiesterase
MTPTLLAQLSDPHIRVGPDDQSSAAALAAAVERVLALRPLPDAVLVSGDIANGATAAEYERARELLAPLPMPVHLLAGNHDDPAALGATAYAVAAGGLRLVVCHTAQPGRDDGRLDVDWLAARLAEDPATPTIVAMHHPPIRIGLPWLDAIGLAAAERVALAELLARSPQVQRVVCGHVHRAAFGSLGGCGVVTCASTNVQARLEIGGADVALGEEPPSILVHALLGDELVTHVQPT